MRKLKKKGMMILLSLILMGGIVGGWGVVLAQEPEEAPVAAVPGGTPFARWNPLRQHITDPLHEAFPKLFIRGFLINESDIRFNRGGTYEHGLKYNHAFDRIEWLADLRYKYHFTDDFSLEGEFNFLYDAAWDWQGSFRHYTVRDPVLGGVRMPTEKAERELEYYHSWKRWFREAYIRWTPGNWEFLLGKQQVRWGKAADVTTAALDVVHAYDFREIWEFVPDDMEYRSTTNWMANISYQFPYIEGLGNLDTQFLIIPDYEPSPNMPYGYNDSVLTFYVPPSVFPLLNISKQDNPSTAIDNWEWGTRIRLLTPNMYDIQLHYMYFWNRGFQGNPTLFQRGLNMQALAALLAGTGTGAGLINLEPKPTRMHMIGMSVEKQYTLGVDQNYLFRLEVAYFKDKYVGTLNESSIAAILAGKDGVKKVNYMNTNINVETSIHPLNLIPGLYKWWAKHVSYPGPADWMAGFWGGFTTVWKFDNDMLGTTFTDIANEPGQTGTADGRIQGEYALAYLSKQFMADRFSWNGAYAWLNGGVNVWVMGLSYEITDALKVTSKLVRTDGDRASFWGLDGRLNQHLEIGFEYNF